MMMSTQLRVSLVARRALLRPAVTQCQDRLVSTILWNKPSNIDFSPKHQIVRWKKKAAKMGNHLEVLDEMAHASEREAAQERRKKKKERKLKKKSKGKGVADDDDDSGAEDFEEEDHPNDGEPEDDDDHEDDELDLPDPKQIETRMMEIVSTFEESLKSIRGAEPTPELFDDIMVDAYGSESTPLKTVAQVVIASPTMASITCFDPALVKEVKTAIQMQLGLNPQTDASEGDAGVLRVPLPKISMEVRQRTAQQLNKRAENFRLRIRRVRRRYNSILKQGKEGKLEHISKDDVFRVAKDIDDATEKAIKKLNEVADKKHSSIMDV